MKKLNVDDESIAKFFDRIEPLGEHMGPILWQLPPNLPKDMRKLGSFIAMLDMWPEVRHAIEFRDESED